MALAGPFGQQQFATAGAEGVKAHRLVVTNRQILYCIYNTPTIFFTI